MRNSAVKLTVDKKDQTLGCEGRGAYGCFNCSDRASIRRFLALVECAQGPRGGEALNDVIRALRADAALCLKLIHNHECIDRTLNAYALLHGLLNTRELRALTCLEPLTISYGLSSSVFRFVFKKGTVMTVRSSPSGESTLEYAYGVLATKCGRTLEQFAFGPRRKGEETVDTAYINRRFRRVFDLLRALHARRVFFHDVKPPNMMERIDGDWILVDYDMCGMDHGKQGTRFYMPAPFFSDEYLSPRDRVRRYDCMPFLMSEYPEYAGWNTYVARVSAALNADVSVFHAFVHTLAYKYLAHVCKDLFALGLSLVQANCVDEALVAMLLSPQGIPGIQGIPMRALETIEGQEAFVAALYKDLYAHLGWMDL